MKETTLFNPTLEQEQEWRIVNDGVMGGVSDSRLRWLDKTALFEGIVSLENNGGFASVRMKSPSIPGDADAFLIRVRGDGQGYRFMARMEGSGEDVNYQQTFETRKDEWMEIRLPVKHFYASFHGRKLPDEPSLNPERVAWIGFLIADKQAGSFGLEIDWIKAVSMQLSSH